MVSFSMFLTFIKCYGYIVIVNSMFFNTLYDKDRMADIMSTPPKHFSQGCSLLKISVYFYGKSINLRFVWNMYNIKVACHFLTEHISWSSKL